MAASPPFWRRPRARPGSLERPVNSRLYRSTWLLFGLPLLVAAFSVGKATPLRQAQPALPPAFDRVTARSYADSLARTYGDRAPGSPGARGAADWLEAQLETYGLRVPRDIFYASIPGRGRTRLENLIAVVPGRTPQALVVMAHRDDAGTGPGANDNASGIAALIELARSYASSISGNTPSGTNVVSPAHTLVFVATDGGEFGGLGSDRFARDYRSRILAAVVLDSIAGRATPRLEITGDTAREASAELVETASARLQEQTGAR